MRKTEILIAVLLAACGAEQAQVVTEAPDVIPATREETHGKHLFLKFCYQCHPGGGPGVGPALDDKPLAESVIRAQIRAGTASMPAFGADWLTDDQVAEIAAYVTTLHRASPSRTAFR